VDTVGAGGGDGGKDDDVGDESDVAVELGEGGECIAVFGDRWIRWELVVTVELAAVLVGGEGAAAAGVGVPKTKVFGTRWERGELNRCGCCRNLLQNLKVTE
jgi:hypothetical protein